jgi:UDP-glucose:(heptosyl)LPS alpha-1,3-glucosyltransferase
LRTRLAIVRQRYTPFGGAEVFVDRAIGALRARGVRVTVVTRQWHAGATKDMQGTAQGAADEIITVAPFYVGRRWRQAGFDRAVCARLAGERDMIVQSHERIACCDVYRAGDGVHAAWLEEKTRGATSVSRKLAYLDPFHRYALDAERRLYASQRLKAVICISRMVQDDVHARFGIARERLPIIYNAIDHDVFSPELRAHRDRTRRDAGIAAGAVVFLFVGSGYARKGAGVAIRALAQVRGPAHLVIVGKDRHAGRYRALADSLRVGSRVTFVGALPDPRAWYGAADAFVLPSLYEPLSNAVLEAMACALPVITSRRCGAGELVAAHGAGTVCDARDVEAVAAAMNGLLDPALRERQGAAARDAVLPLTPRAMTDRLLALYAGLLG